MKTLAEIITFLEDVLGKAAAQTFDENMEEFTYFVRSEALTNSKISESKMRSRLRRLAEGILAASVKSYLTENYADDFGEVELNVGEDAVYDRNMRPIDAIEKIRKSQKEIMSLMVNRGMTEFNKGRELAKVIESRSKEKKEPSPKDANWSPARARRREKTIPIEVFEVEIMRLERLLPNLTSEQAKRLSDLYRTVKAAYQKVLREFKP